jgi:LmbE family N-acetylglucosaminyl deacetylase
MKRQRTLLGVWAHPDDEAFLSAGLMAQARRDGERVVVVTATLGEHGTSDPERFPPSCLRKLRHHELRNSLAAVGVDELRIIGFEDGTCQEHDGTEAVADHIADVAPDRIVTFGPDGITGHPDHRAVSRWTTDAWSAMRPDAALWYATKTPEFHREFGEVNEAIGLWNEQPEPPSIPESECESLTLDAGLLDRKIAALRAHRSQTQPLIKLMGPEVFRGWVRTEWFRAVESGGQP